MSHTVVPELSAQVVLTLSYCDQFEYPLKKQELFQRIISLSKKVPQNSKHDLVRNFEEALDWLVSASLLSISGEYVVFRGREALRYTRMERQKNAVLLRDSAQQLYDVCRFIPWLSGVYVTGALAMENTPQGDDIDFMIVTAANRMWLVRPLVLLVAMGYKKLRVFGSDSREKWCFNMWLEEPSLKMESSRRTLYGAYEVLQARPFWMRSPDLHQRFLHANSWASLYVPNLFTTACQDFSFRVAQQKNWIHTFLEGGFLWSWLNFLAYWLQRAYMARHHSIEEVQLSRAFFHPLDMRNTIWDRWKQRVEKNVTSDSHDHEKTVVLVTGVFDLLHVEHRNFLTAAANAGDVLVVGVESDVRVKKLKGEGRPIDSQEVRLAAVKALGIADTVFILPEQFDSPTDYEDLIKTLQPDILAVSEHSPHQDKKQAIMKKFGGRVEVVYKHNPEISTTKIIASRGS